MAEKMIFASTIYDTCKQQDCLTPECNINNRNAFLISPARNGTGFEVEIVDEDAEHHFHIAPDEVIYVTDDYGYVEVVEDSLETLITVLKFTEDTYNKGYYNLTIKYRFNFAIKFFDYQYVPKSVYINSIPVESIQAYTTYTKNVTLFGSEIKNRVTTLSSCSGQCCSNFPEYNIQATTDILSAKLTKLPKLLCNADVDQSKTGDEEFVTVVSVTIGLFTIISLFRNTRLNVVIGEGITIPTCHHNFNPCEDFNSEPFPYDIFNAEKNC